MRFSEEDVINLSDEVKSRLSEKRYLHTLSVKAAAEKIGHCFKNIDLSELSCAALLHDVSKELSFDEQIDLIDNSGFILTDEDRLTPAILHSFSAPAVIASDFPRFATERIISAVRNHTTGAPGMTVFDRIVFIADYVEDLRTYESCISVRNNLYSKLFDNSNDEEKERALNKAIYDSLVFTENEVLKRGRKLNLRSLKTKEYFYELLTKSQL